MNQYQMVWILDANIELIFSNVIIADYCHQKLMSPKELWQAKQTILIQNYYNGNLQFIIAKLVETF